MKELLQNGLTWDTALLVCVSALKIVAIIVIGLLAIKFADKLVDIFVKRRNEGKDDATLKKALTLSNIAKSVIKWFVYFIIIMVILGEFGMDTAATSIITTAGIGGLAISFGAQNLVKDMVTGGFMLYEDQYKIGDYIKVAGVEGFVENVSLRITKIRSVGGEFYIIPNGQITMVTNLSTGNSTAAVEVGVSYNTSIDKAIESMGKAGKEFVEQVDYAIGDPVVMGVTKLGDYSIDLKMVCQVKSMRHFEAQRLLLKLIKEQFDKDGIEIPFPTYTLGGKESEECPEPQKG